MRRLACLLALTLTASVPVAVNAQAPNPNQPYIQNITYGGTGCPGGSVGQSIANDRMSFVLIFDSFVASSGPGVPITESRKNCQLNINVRVPNGSGQYCAVVDYRGYTQLPAGMTSEQRAAYYNGASSYELPDGEVITVGPIAEHVTEFTGPVAKDYVSRDSVDLSWNGGEPVISPLNINAQVRLFGSGTGQITTDSLEGRLTPGQCEGPADTTAPTITIANPIAQGLYGLGAIVTPAFQCHDEGSGVASCTAAPAIDTSAIGPKTFTVTAVDNAGNTSTASVTYAVGGKNECKGGGHSRFLAPAFTNQGQCVSSFVK